LFPCFRSFWLGGDLLVLTPFFSLVLLSSRLLGTLLCFSFFCVSFPPWGSVHAVIDEVGTAGLSFLFLFFWACRFRVPCGFVVASFLICRFLFGFCAVVPLFATTLSPPRSPRSGLTRCGTLSAHFVRLLGWLTPSVLFATLFSCATTPSAFGGCRV